MDFSQIMGSTCGMPSFAWAHAVFDARVKDKFKHRNFVVIAFSKVKSPGINMSSVDQ